jgi:hypothetical protein
VDTYDRRSQLKASRRRLEDAIALQSCQRWTGAIYLGGYAIECSLKSLICDRERKNNFKDTSSFQTMQGSNLHNLAKLLEQIPSLRKIFEQDKTQKYKQS